MTRVGYGSGSTLAYYSNGDHERRPEDKPCEGLEEPFHSCSVYHAPPTQRGCLSSLLEAFNS